MCEKVRHSNLATHSFQTTPTSTFTTVLRLTVFTAVFSNKIFKKEFWKSIFHGYLSEFSLKISSAVFYSSIALSLEEAIFYEFCPRKRIEGLVRSTFAFFCIN